MYPSFKLDSIKEGILGLLRINYSAKSWKKISRRKLEFCKYSKVEEEEAVMADLYGVVTSLFPTKKSQSAVNQYYDGQVCDGT